MLLKALLLRVVVFIVRISPFKIFTIEILIRFATLRILLGRKRSPWSQIAGFAKLNGVTDTGWRYAYRYFVEQARSGTWSHLYYELPNQLNKYISIEGLSELKEATRHGRGAVLVGAHFGPSVVTFLLQQEGVVIRPVVGDQRLLQSPDIPRVRRRLTSSRRRTFFGQEMQSFEAKKSERDLVRYVRQGGVVSMLIDYPRPRVGGAPVCLFGKPLRLYYFPFKLARKYGVPVFFYFFEITPGGRYRLRISPARDFSSPVAGTEDYAHHLEKHVRTYPYASMSFIRSFMEPS